MTLEREDKYYHENPCVNESCKYYDNGWPANCTRIYNTNMWYRDLIGRCHKATIILKKNIKELDK